MKKNFEYKEPEFKVHVSKNEDVITTSLPGGSLGRVTDDWEDVTFEL